MSTEPKPPTDDADDRPFERLAIRYLDSSLDERGLAELNALLAAQPELRAEFNDLCWQTLAISERFAAEEVCTPASGRMPWFSRRRLLVGSAAAAGVLIAAGLKALSWRPGAQPDAAEDLAVARLEDAAGTVYVSDGGSEDRPVVANQPLRLGQTISTVGESSSARLRCADGTPLVLGGNTSVVIAGQGAERIHLRQGDLAAGARQRPLRIVTPEAEVEACGTTLSLTSAAQQTRVGVAEPAGPGLAAVQLKRLSDGLSVPIRPGQWAVAHTDGELRPETLPSAPDHLLIKFGPQLPSGWGAGELVFDDLPEGSEAAMRAVAAKGPRGRTFHKVRTQNAWTNGLFAIHDDSWLHVRFRVERRGFFHCLVVARDRDAARRTSVVLEHNRFWQRREPRQWYTAHLPFADFRPTYPDVQIEKPLIAFVVLFDSQQADIGLTVDRFWLTRGPETH